MPRLRVVARRPPASAALWPQETFGYLSCGHQLAVARVQVTNGWVCLARKREEKVILETGRFAKDTRQGTLVGDEPRGQGQAMRLPVKSSLPWTQLRVGSRLRLGPLECEAGGPGGPGMAQSPQRVPWGAGRGPWGDVVSLGTSEVLGVTCRVHRLGWTPRHADLRTSGAEPPPEEWGDCVGSGEGDLGVP